jgi:hypothetical protein
MTSNKALRESKCCEHKHKFGIVNDGENIAVSYPTHISQDCDCPCHRPVKEATIEGIEEEANRQAQEEHLNLCRR